MQNSQGSEGNVAMNKDYKTRYAGSSDGNTGKSSSGNSSVLWFYAFMFTLYECVLIVFDMTHRHAVPEWAYFVPFFFVFGLPVVAIVASVAMLVGILCLVVVLVVGGSFGWFLVTGAIALWDKLVRIFHRKKTNATEPN